MTTTVATDEETLLEVRRERTRQVEKWGEQFHPAGTSGDAVSVALMEQQKARVDRLHAEGQLTYWDILLEEVLEVNAETDDARLYVELVQVASVAVGFANSVAARLRAEGVSV